MPANPQFHRYPMGERPMHQNQGPQGRDHFEHAHRTPNMEHGKHHGRRA